MNFVPATYYTPALGCGVTLRLNAVQVVELVEWENKSADLGFQKVEGYKSPEKEEVAEEAAPVVKEMATTEEEL